MARAFTPKVLTANRLLEGDVVYLGADGAWVLNHSKAVLFTDEALANAALSNAAAQPDFLVGAYLANAEIRNGHPAPIHFREEFRTRGPSNYAHGKQESIDV
jgi:hypothetical protein